MNKKNFLGIAYVSAWVMIWGTIGSFIDFAFLETDSYRAGSTGQLITFSLSAFISIVIATFLFPKIMSKD